MDGVNYARQAYDAQLRELEHEMLEMASRAELMVADAVESLVNLDRTKALEVMSRDDEIDVREIQIESRCMRLLALQQPTGADLRLVGSVLKIITDIERVADLAVDLAKFTNKIDNENGRTDFIDIPRISSLCRQMFREAIQAYVRRDLQKIEQVAIMEQEVDDLYRELREQIFDRMRKEPEEVVPAGWLFLAAHHLERIADHALNIAERVGYMVTGEMMSLGRPITAPLSLTEENALETLRTEVEVTPLNSGTSGF